MNIPLSLSPASIAAVALCYLLGGVGYPAPALHLTRPISDANLVFEEIEGQVAVEAEHFYKQTATGTRAWHISSSKATPAVSPDGDPPHLGGASAGAYLEILPDTRRTHDNRLIQGENFSNQPGKLGLLHYKIHFNNPGRYYVWVRAFSTGSEDNGLHVGLDGKWPESGQRLQWCEGKNTWRWESKQRTPQQHCGEPYKIFLDIETPGEHEILFSMREDGFEFDKFILTKDRLFARPVDAGPKTRVRTGRLPKPFEFVAAAEPATAAPLSRSPATALVDTRQPDGDASVRITGELKQWHKVTLTLNGPFAHERDTQPNPFTDYRMDVTFAHESGSPRYRVPGYFAADGDAANTSAQAGTQWRAHVSPDKSGQWSYSVAFYEGNGVAVGQSEGAPLEAFHERAGIFTVGPTDKTGRDFRAHGRLTYVGTRYLQFSGSGEYFLKAGPDAPETLLAYADFDGTTARKAKVPLKTWQPHIKDWRTGDPTWKNIKGKGLIGALNYLASKRVNTFSFLPYNAGGDGDNVWPFVARETKLHYDVSKLHQWGIVFDHATAQGLHLHFKLQENEMDDDRRGHDAEPGAVPESLDGGRLGPERKLYCRELIARFAHNLALNWNIGEENTQSTEEVRQMVKYLHDTDPYRHHIVIHTFPGQQDKVYTPLLGDQSHLTGVSLQNGWDQVHRRTLKWITESDRAGRPWVVANDEQNPASHGAPPDSGYQGHDGVARPGQNGKSYTLHDIRKMTLWGNLMAGGAGVEYYFGYQLPENDLVCEDFRSRDQSWDYCRVALEFFQKLPFSEMSNADGLIDNAAHDNSRFCLAKPGQLYLVYLPNGGTTELDLTGQRGAFSVQWFNSRKGGPLTDGSVKSVSAGARVSLGTAPTDPSEDWVVVVRP